MLAAMAEDRRESEGGADPDFAEGQAAERKERGERAKEQAAERKEDRGQTAEPAAPSIGARTKIEHVPPEERLAGKEHSKVDAMGLDKYRQVAGESYGPSRTRVLMRFVVFFAVVGLLFIGLLFLVGELDQPPSEINDAAPWSAPDTEQRNPAPVQ
jgi:hypothetical protein